MRKVKLFTRGGEFVIEIEVLPFALMPEVIQWGTRIFVRENDERYLEGFLYVHPPEYRLEKR